MRTLDATTEAEIAKAVTSPGYLVEIDTQPPVRFSTRGSLVYDGNLYLDGASVRKVAPGASKAEIQIPNHDNAASALVLGYGLEDVAVRIYAIHGDAPTARDLLWSGVIDGAELSTRWARLTCSAAARSGGAVPDIVIAPPLCNHLPAPGTSFLWNGEKYVLQASSRG